MAARCCLIVCGKDVAFGAFKALEAGGVTCWDSAARCNGGTWLFPRWRIKDYYHNRVTINYDRDKNMDDIPICPD